MENKKELAQRIAKAVKKLKKQGFLVESLKKDATLFIQINSEVSRDKDNDMSIVTFLDGSQGLLINGVIHHLEIYAWKDHPKDVSRTVGLPLSKIGLEIMLTKDDKVEIEVER